MIGPKAVKIFNTFKWNEDGDTTGDDKKVGKILGKYEKYCSPQCNVTYESHQFNIQNQNEVDAGAQCNVLPLHVYTQINRNKPLKSSNSRLVSYSGHRLDTVGKVTLLVSTKDK